MVEQVAEDVSYWINKKESTFSQIDEVEYIMKKFIRISDVMFDPNLGQSGPQKVCHMLHIGV